MSQSTKDYKTVCDCVDQWSQGHQQARSKVEDHMFFAQASTSQTHEELPQQALSVPANWMVKISGETHAHYRQVVTCFDQSQGSLAKFIGSGEGVKMKREVVSGAPTEEWVVNPAPEPRTVVFQFGYYVGKSSHIQAPKIARTNYDVLAKGADGAITSFKVTVGTEDWSDNDNNDTILSVTFTNQPA